MLKKSVVTVLMMLVATLTNAASSDSELIIMESGGQRITAADLHAELSKASADVRLSMLFNKNNMQALAANLLVRRVMAENAKAINLQGAELTAAQLQLAWDKVMSDAYLQMLDDKNVPNEEMLQKLALEEYKTNIKKYSIPEQVRASHILITEDAGGYTKAEELLKEIQAGADFGDLAKKYSKDPGSAQRGGDLGFFGRGRMVKEFEETAFSLPVNGVSPVIKSQFGFHVLKLTEKKSESISDFDVVKTEIVDGLKVKLKNNGRQAYAEKVIDAGKQYPENLEKYIANQSVKK